MTAPEETRPAPGEDPVIRDLDLLDTEALLRVMNAEDRGVAEAVGRVVPEVAAAVEAIADRVRGGGRVHLFGAGTSGRLGVLDASEMPPTFGVPSDLFQGHVAGGSMALTHAVEGAEDDEGAGGSALGAAGVTEADAVVVLSASGRTPWCLGVLKAARDIGAVSVGITCNTATPLGALAAIVVAPRVGEEVLAGSTRLKAGTAQKLVLNMISTAVMVRLGKTYGNLMVGVRPTNSKLRDRAEQLVSRIAGCEAIEHVREVLQQCGWNVRAACLCLMHNLDPKEAARVLDAAGGSLREALARDRDGAN